MPASALAIRDNRPSRRLDFTAVTRRAGWPSGADMVGPTLQIVGEELCEALDVAAGNGNAALAAARRWCDVTATDPVRALLACAHERAVTDRLDIDFREADADALPFADGSFDVVMSTFGVMFTPDQERAAAELVRVCRRGGKIGLANWTPEGFIGRVLEAIGKHMPPPAGEKSPCLWGTRARIAELFKPHASSITSEQRSFTFRYRSPEHWLTAFKIHYRPLLAAFAALDAAARAELERDLMRLISQLNYSGNGSMVVASEYLEIVITRR